MSQQEEERHQTGGDKGEEQQQVNWKKNQATARRDRELGKTLPSRKKTGWEKTRKFIIYLSNQEKGLDKLSEESERGRKKEKRGYRGRPPTRD